MTQEPLVGQEWLKSLKPLSEEQKQKNREEAAWIKERQQRCRAMEAEYMRELQENSEKREKRFNFNQRPQVLCKQSVTAQHYVMLCPTKKVQSDRD